MTFILINIIPNVTTNTLDNMHKYQIFLSSFTVKKFLTIVDINTSPANTSAISIPHAIIDSSVLKLNISLYMIICNENIVTEYTAVYCIRYK